MSGNGGGGIGTIAGPTATGAGTSSAGGASTGAGVIKQAVAAITEKMTG